MSRSETPGGRRNHCGPLVLNTTVNRPVVLRLGLVSAAILSAAWVATAVVAPAVVPEPDPATDPTATNDLPTPYHAIVARNPFGLRTPPPPAPVDAPAPSVTVSALKLTGVTTLLGGRRAMFAVQEPGKTNLFSDLVREGDFDSVITNLQVMKIDERAGVVQVVYGGKDLTLDFAANGIKPPVGPAVPTGPPPGSRGPGPPPVAVGGFNADPAARMIPPRPVRSTEQVTPSSALMRGEQQAPVLTPEQQARLFQEQENVARAAGVPLPPSPMNAGSGGPPVPGGGIGPPPLPGTPGQ